MAPEFTDFDRARKEKWRREGFAHEAEVPSPQESPLFYVVVFGLLLPLLIVLWPFYTGLQWWERRCG